MSHEILEIPRGDQFSLSVAITDDDDLPIDITGATIFFTVRRWLKESEEGALIEKEVTDHVDPTNGETEIPLTNDDTSIQAGDYYYDIRIKFPEVSPPAAFDGDIHTIIPADKLRIVNHATNRIE